VEEENEEEEELKLLFEPPPIEVDQEPLIDPFNAPPSEPNALRVKESKRPPPPPLLCARLPKELENVLD
jgi:hypothetical protein